MMRSTVHPLLVASILVGLASARLGAQVPASLEPIDSGRVIRAWIGEAQVRGRLLAPLRDSADSVPYCRYPGPPCGINHDPRQIGWLVPDRIVHLEVATGTRAVRGAWIGGGGMAVLTYLTVSLVNGIGEGGGNPSAGGILVGSLIGGGLTGGIFGALIGSGFDKMERVY